LEFKFEVEIIQSEERKRIDKEVKKHLAAAGLVDPSGKLKIKGVSPKMLKRMKQEHVECPVMDRNVQFLQCFVCANFQSRVNGRVLCKGDPL